LARLFDIFVELLSVTVMKKELSLLLLGFIFFACGKTNNSNSLNFATIKISYQATINMGNKVFNVSHFSTWSADRGFLFDSLKQEGHTVCAVISTGSTYSIQLCDTAIGSIYLLQFSIPSLSTTTKFKSNLYTMDINDSTYVGPIVVSTTMTSNGNKTYNGSFSMSGTVMNRQTLDSTAFTGSGTFKNMPYE
jgi:hypothetical protein